MFDQDLKDSKYNVLPGVHEGHAYQWLALRQYTRTMQRMARNDMHVFR